MLFGIWGSSLKRLVLGRFVLGPAICSSCTMGEVDQVMAPLPACCLGWFCIGYHMSDVLGRDECIAELLRRSGVAAPELCTASTVRSVLARLLTSHPGWITIHPQGSAAVTPLASTSAGPAHSCLSSCFQEWMPGAVAACCGQPLTRWKVLPATFLTLARGARRGNVVCLRCPECGAVFAGCWKWTSVPQGARFPDGFHAPFLASLAVIGSRWFFATPQLVIDVMLLTYLIGLLARGGVSFTAFSVVYQDLWCASLKGTMYMDRAKLLQKLEISASLLQLSRCSPRAAWPHEAFSGTCAHTTSPWTLSPS